MKKLLSHIFVFCLLLGFEAEAQLTNITFTMTPNPCNGMNVATITAIPVGGGPSYTYLWTTIGQTTQTAVGLIQNTYICKVTDLSDGTSKTKSFGFLDPPDLIVDVSSTPVSCNGGSNGTATADALGTGTGPYTYLWSPDGETTDVITGKQAGTYSVTVTDANGCQVKPGNGGPVLTVNVTQPSLLVTNGTSTNVLCNGANNGTAGIDPQGSGTPGYTYTWNTGANTSAVTGLMPGAYSCTVTDTKTCTATFNTTITQPNVLTVSLNNPTLLCSGNCDATLNTTVNGGTAGYNYSWSPGGETTPTIGSLCAGIYSTTVTDANLCVATATHTIASPAAITLVTSNTDNPCYGDCIATATVVATGGTGAGTFGYMWASGYGTASTLSGLCMGDYSVTVTDANNCLAGTSLTVNQAPSLTVTSSHTDVTCNGACDGTAQATVSGGVTPYHYSWSPGGETTSSISNKCAATYTLEVGDNNGCSASDVILTITQPLPLSSVVTGTLTSCVVNNGTLTVSGSGGTTPYRYLWSTGETTAVITGVGPGTYTATTTDANNCVNTRTVSIATVVTLTVSPTTTSLLCSGDCDASAFSNASGGTPPYSYRWSNGATDANILNSLCAASYSVTVTDNFGCVRGNITTITDPSPLTLAPTSASASCNGMCDGSALANAGGGTGTITYFWVPGNQTTGGITGRCAGTYTIQVQDANNCVNTETITISQASSLSPNTTVVNSTCNGSDGSIALNPSGGTAPYFYSWSNAETTSAITGLAAGIYSVSVWDIASCSSDFMIIVSNDGGPALSTYSTNASCFGICDGTATVDVTSGSAPYEFLFMPGGQTAAGVNTFSVSGLCAGIHTVRVEDNSGCITMGSYDIQQPPAILPGINITAVSCNGGSDGRIALFPSGGVGGPFTFLWASGSQTTSSISGLPIGVYSVTVTDASGCNIQPPIPVTQPSALSIVMSFTNVTCNGSANGTAAALVSGGTTPYSYSWSTGASASVITGCGPGNYQVTVTDANLCVISQTVSITQPTALSPAKNFTNATCNGYCNGVAAMDISGGTTPYSFLFSPGGQTAGAVTTFSVSGVCAGTYTATATDANGCVASQSYTITAPAALNITLTTTSVSCNAFSDGATDAFVTGGTGTYDYSWSNGATSEDIAALAAGGYTITIRDDNNCTAVAGVSINEPAAIAPNASANTPLCINSCDGNAGAVPTGGLGGYGYSWAPGGKTSSSISNLCAGNYTVTVTDNNACSVSEIITITAPPAISITYTGGFATCGQVPCNGSFTVTPTGGTGAYAYAWTPNVSGSNIASTLCAGAYTVTITDANSCDSAFVIAVNNVGAPTLIVTTTSVTCNSSCNGTASVEVDISGGDISPYSFLFVSGGQTATAVTSFSVNAICSGTHFMQVKDSNDCTVFGVIDIVQPLPVTPNQNITSPSCSGVCNGAIGITPGGGNGVYTYLWSEGGETASLLSDVCEGTYTVTITDGNNCISDHAISISNYSTLIVGATSISPSCAGNCDGKAIASIISGTSPFSYSWNDPLSQTNDTATSLCPGSYSISITDGAGCQAIAAATVTGPVPVSVSPAVTDAACGLCDGEITVTPSGGTGPYSYAWNNSSTTSVISGLCAGIYDVDITDALGCAGNASVIVNNNSGPTGASSFSVDATCYGICDGAASVTPIGGAPPYAYLWIPGGQTTQFMNDLCAGSYNVQILDNNDCSYIVPITINQPSPIGDNRTVVNVPCGTTVCSGSITLNPSGAVAPYTYVWSDLSTSSSLSNLCTGIFSVTITASNGCSQPYVIPINTTNGPNVSVTSADPACGSLNDGTATANASGGTGGAPYTFLWTPGNLTTNSITGLSGGTYIVQVADASGCTSAARADLDTPSPISFSSAVITNPSCAGMCNGTASVLPNGGALPYSYSWTGGSNNAMAAGLCNGTYTVTVTDASNCPGNQVITISEPPPLNISNAAIDASCNAASDGNIATTVSGGAAPYKYLWAPGGSTTQDISNVLPDTYTVIVTDNKGCTITNTVTVGSLIAVIANAGNNVSVCQASQTITLDASSSTNATGYEWIVLPANTSISNGVTATVVPDNPGTISYVVIATNGVCLDRDTVAVTAHALPGADAGASTTLFMGQSVAIGGSPTGPTGATFSWTPLWGLDDSTIANPTATPEVNTTFTVFVADENGCVSLDTVRIVILPQINAPTGFTPNGDGSNDDWEIDNIERFPKCLVEIYNRWGELLFSSTGYTQRWDGKNKGRELPDGTYYYIINLNDPMFPGAITGPITIMR